jgi:hypothetical protein
VNPVPPPRGVKQPQGGVLKPPPPPHPGSGPNKPK